MKNADLTEDQLIDIILNAAVVQQKTYGKHYFDVREFMLNNYRILPSVSWDIILTMKGRGLIVPTEGDSYLVQVTEIGKEIQANGGWQEHLKRKAEEERKAKTIQEWEIQKTEYEAKLAKRNYLTYWLLLAFALIAALGGIASIISLIK